MSVYQGQSTGGKVGWGEGRGRWAEERWMGGVVTRRFLSSGLNTEAFSWVRGKTIKMIKKLIFEKSQDTVNKGDK